MMRKFLHSKQKKSRINFVFASITKRKASGKFFFASKIKKSDEKILWKIFCKKIKSLTWSASRPHRLPAARCGILRGVGRSATAEIRGGAPGRSEGRGGRATRRRR